MPGAVQGNLNPISSLIPTSVEYPKSQPNAVDFSQALSRKYNGWNDPATYSLGHGVPSDSPDQSSESEGQDDFEMEIETFENQPQQLQANPLKFLPAQSNVSHF